MIEGARAFMPVVERAYPDPRSHLVIDDAKAHFARSGRKYDVIISEPSNPWVSGVASLFTGEFYRRVHGQLNDGGLLVQWIQVYEFNLDLLASVLKPLGDVFDDYVVYYAGGGDLVIVASAKGALGEPSGAPSPALFAEPRLAARLAHLGIRSLSDLALWRISAAQEPRRAVHLRHPTVAAELRLLPGRRPRGAVARPLHAIDGRAVVRPRRGTGPAGRNAGGQAPGVSTSRCPAARSTNHAPSAQCRTAYSESGPRT